MRVLVAEDYAPIRTAVVQALREAGFSVDEVADGEDALARGGFGDYDVIVLDLMLPRMDGFKVLEQLRARGHQSHVLILTARDAVDDRVRGLDLGADDYLVKPFAMEELVARVRALIRREYRVKEPVVTVGDVQINTSSHTVEVAGEKVELTAREYALLEYMLHRKGEVVTRMDIWEHLYDDRSNATSNVVDVYIGYLRKKIEKRSQHKLFHTRRGEGYVFAEHAP